MGKAERIVHHCDLSFKLDTNDVLICDECDSWMLEQPSQFVNLVRKKGVICLTGTPCDGRGKSLESSIARLMMFKTFERDVSGVDSAVPC